MAGIGSLKMVKLYEYTVSKDGSGDNKETLALRHRTFADVMDAGGGRSEDNRKTVLSNTKKFKIRWRSNWVINGDWRVKYFGQEYAVSKIERIDEKRFNWLITATAK